MAFSIQNNTTLWFERYSSYFLLSTKLEKTFYHKNYTQENTKNTI